MEYSNNLKIFQKEESEAWNSMVFQSKTDSKGDRGIDWERDFSAFYRFQRFFDSTKGFHLVSFLPFSYIFL